MLLRSRSVQSEARCYGLTGAVQTDITVCKLCSKQGWRYFNKITPAYKFFLFPFLPLSAFLFSLFLLLAQLPAQNLFTLPTALRRKTVTARFCVFKIRSMQSWVKLFGVFLNEQMNSTQNNSQVVHRCICTGSCLA